jgi:Domain of unknown function (DU1801)
MAKTELKTKENEASVEDFLNTIDDENVRNDCKVIAEMMSKATNTEAKMWGANIIGFGSRVIKYDSGRELDWMIVGFSPRKANISLYGLSVGDNLLAKLGKHKSSKGCLYIKKLSDVDSNILDNLIRKSVSNKS